jgi:hypothetical protein
VTKKLIKEELISAKPIIFDLRGYPLNVSAWEIYNYLYGNDYKKSWKQTSFEENYIRHDLMPTVDGVKNGQDEPLNLAIKNCKRTKFIIRQFVEKSLLVKLEGFFISG